MASLLFTFVYGWLLLPLLWLAAWGAAPFQGKVRAALLARRGWRRAFREALARREAARPLVWVHAASAGEFLQAEPVLRRLRDDGAQLAVTLSSPSGLRWLERISGWPELVWDGLLPLDFPWNVRKLLEGLRPAAIVYLQAELPPGLVGAARARAIPQALIAARIGSGANYRARPFLRALYAGLYGAMAAILCTTERDRAGIAAIVPRHPRLEVAGDPGIETVLARLKEAPPPAPPPGWDGAVLVAGSTWPADEAVLLPVLAEALAAFPALRAVLAPHEPGEGALARLERSMAAAGTARLSRWEGAAAGGEARDARVVLVDSVGRLSALYGLGSVAFVGGAFSSGVHNVAEPAACGMPVLFGPRHGNSAMAALLIESGAGIAVTDVPSLRTALWPLLEDAARRAALGAKAREIVQHEAGAAERCYKVVRELMGGGA